jgi:hypothetical protein
MRQTLLILQSHPYHIDMIRGGCKEKESLSQRPKASPYFLALGLFELPTAGF